jgi:hypothetical protein
MGALMFTMWCQEIIRIEELMKQYMTLKSQTEVQPLFMVQDDVNLEKMKEYRQHIITQMYQSLGLPNAK